MNTTNDENNTLEQPKEKKRSIFRNKYGELNGRVATVAGVIGVIAIFTVIGLAKACFKIVPPAHQAIVVNGGELADNTKSDGFYVKVPIWTEIIPVYTGTLSTDEDAKGNFKEENPFRGIQPLSKDGQVLEMDAQINYSVVDPVLFKNKTNSTEPRTIEQLVFIPKLRKLVYNYTAEYGWKNLIQEGSRQEFEQRIFNTLSSGEETKRVCKEEYTEIDDITGVETIVAAGCVIETVGRIETPQEYGVAISAINFKKIQPNQKIIAAVETAQAKEQEVKIAAQEAEITKEQANKRIEDKRGETESKKLEADAAAYTIRVELEEEAKGVSALAKSERERASALAASQQLVEYKKLEIEMRKADALVEFGKNWTGSVPDSVNIIGTDEARDMSIFYGMGGVVANPRN